MSEQLIIQFVQNFLSGLISLAKIISATNELASLSREPGNARPVDIWGCQAWWGGVG